MKEYRILITDDHPAVREGVKAILSQLEGVACDTCGSIEQLNRQLVDGNKPDLFVLDMEFPGNDVFDVFSTIKKEHPQGHILIYTCHEEPWLLARLEDNTISGFVSKRSSAEVLCLAVAAIRRGETFFDACYDNVRAHKADARTADDDEMLSTREHQVLEYMTKGLSTREIAEKMHLSVFTIKTYRTRLAKKLHAKNAVDVVVKGRKLNRENKAEK